jgi:putative membrane protein
MYGHGHMLFLGSREVFMWAPLLIFAGLLVYLVVRVLRSNGSDQITQETPLDVLKRRYARGEITQDEFEQAKEQFLEPR